tara:strand:- start:92 stop:286 length:195 start_codon:yes stop_codon:yes gene_type:complete
MKLTKTKLKQIIEEELKEAHIVRETTEEAKALKDILTNMVREMGADAVLKVVKTQVDLIVREGN